MNVSDFQKCLRSIAEAIGAAKGAGQELTKAADALNPFGNQSMADFAKFLALAEETYRTTGKLPTVKPPEPKPLKPPPPPKLTADQLALVMEDIRRRLANNEPLTRAAVTGELAKFEALTKPALAKVVKELGYKKKPETKTEALECIADRLTAGTIAEARAGV